MMLLTLAQTAAADAASNDMFMSWGFILLAAAIVLLVVELVIPSGGLVGILCGVSLVASVVAFYKYDSAWGIGMGVAYVIVLPIALVFIFKLWLHSPLAKRMILGGSVVPADDEETGAVSSEAARLKRLAELRQLIGAEGVAETSLRPVGTVRISGQRIDGMAETGVIQANTPVVVTDVYDNQVKVRPR